jgi:methionyl-tRNA formyltransferase|tara:strand:+ start:974 stop:1609 length:636 start_codon:yes stop_codon:yes gene_type:complete
MKKIQILIDNKNSWIIPYAESYCEKINQFGYICKIIYSHKDVEMGDVIILLSCEKKFNELSKNKYNIVVHESDLPQGKGWSPLTYQVLEGKNEIPITLFEASNDIDTGYIYFKDLIKLNGSELVDELREKQSKKTFELVDRFLNSYDKSVAHKQEGEETFYRRRDASSSRLDINKTIKDNFNLLRVVDNQKYPAFFIYKNQKYVLKIHKDG